MLDASTTNTTLPPGEAAIAVQKLEKEVKRLEGCMKVCVNAARKGEQGTGVPEFVKGKPHYAFLVLAEHPYGREMMQ
jgi:hypothetical protein